tara:strand:+ start:503 stop:979 length:477 start_codon:yes stop_codon:yes gene_type:complete
MNIFNSNNDLGKEKSEFKAYAESKMLDEGFKSRFAGYDDKAILNVLKEEFSKFKHASPSKEGQVSAKKGKIPTFKSIGDALKTQDFGTTFTTPQSDRIYVITKGTWGDKSQNKVVKGFDLGTDMDKIRKFARRTRVKHGGANVNTLKKDEITPTMRKK